MEIWIPYGEVESLVTLKAENLGETLDIPPESHLDEITINLLERIKDVERVVVCDTKPSTVKVVKAIAAKSEVRFLAPAPKKVEAEATELRGRVEALEPPTESLPGHRGMKASRTLTLTPKKLVLATGEPDPLVGYLDARAALALRAVDGTRKLAYDKRDGDEPRPLKDTPSHDALVEVVGGLPGLIYATIVTRGGQPYSVIEGGTAEARGSFATPDVPRAKGVVIGAGGRGHDETLSHSIRLAVGAVNAARSGGEVIIVAECKEGLGSTALEMFCSGRITDGFIKKGAYVEGLEEIHYVTQLRDNYSVTLLSTLPELYASGRLKFRTARGSGEALNKAFGVIGKTAKLNVVTRASETVVL